MPAHQGFKPALGNGTRPEASAKERSGNRPVSEDRVTITQNREKVLNLPEFDPDVGVPDAALQRAIDAYYGHV